MNVEYLKALGQKLAHLADDYCGGPKREMRIDPALYAFLISTGRKVERQWHAGLPGYERPPRIDFRVGGANAVLIEFAVRPPGGGSNLYGSQNVSELRKLSRFGNDRAKLRSLLLVDLSPWPIAREDLKRTYDKIHAGRGRFARHPVKVVYAHAGESYAFKWSPYKTV